MRLGGTKLTQFKGTKVCLLCLPRFTMDSSKISQSLFRSKTTFIHQPVPDRRQVESFLGDFLDLTFPGMLRKNFADSKALDTCLTRHLDLLSSFGALLSLEKVASNALRDKYAEQLMVLSAAIERDAAALYAGDPAATGLEEVLLCYPGLYAVATHRLANFFNTYGLKYLPRLISEIAHEKTGIDIHPGASIGESFFIDHGTGVVIGETAIIGDHVKIYQGVTLGALSVDKSLATLKRHPTIEDGCVIYSNATILGGSTTIGAGSVIGGNVWITKSVPANSLVYHKSELRLDRIDSEKHPSESFTSVEELSYEI